MNFKKLLTMKKYWQRIQAEVLIIIIAILVSFVITGIFISAVAANPLQAIHSFLRGIFGRIYGIGEILVKATPLLLIGLGVSIAFKGGLTNLGGDGQFYMGALAATWVGVTFSGIPTFIHMLLIIISAIIAGAFWGGIVGFLKAKLNINEVIMTIMMNYVSMYFVSFLNHGPLKDPNGYLPQTRQLAKNLRFIQIIPNTRAHFGILLGLVAAVFIYIFLSKTILGYRIKAVGISKKASIYAGINTDLYTIMIMALSGAFAGVAGMVEVYGIHYRLLDGISPDYGFSAVVVALLGKLHPIGILIASMFMGSLLVGANSMQVSMKIPVSIVYITQSLVILFMLIGRNLEIDWPKKLLPPRSLILKKDKEGVLGE